MKNNPFLISRYTRDIIKAPEPGIEKLVRILAGMDGLLGRIILRGVVRELMEQCPALVHEIRNRLLTPQTILNSIADEKSFSKIVVSTDNNDLAWLQIFCDEALVERISKFISSRRREDIEYEKSNITKKDISIAPFVRDRILYLIESLSTEKRIHCDSMEDVFESPFCIKANVAPFSERVTLLPHKVSYSTDEPVTLTLISIEETGTTYMLKTTFAGCDKKKNEKPHIEYLRINEFGCRDIALEPFTKEGEHWVEISSSSNGTLTAVPILVTGKSSLKVVAKELRKTTETTEISVYATYAGNPVSGTVYCEPVCRVCGRHLKGVCAELQKGAGTLTLPTGEHGENVILQFVAQTPSRAAFSLAYIEKTQTEDFGAGVLKIGFDASRSVIVKNTGDDLFRGMVFLFADALDADAFWNSLSRKVIAHNAHSAYFNRKIDDELINCRSWNSKGPLAVKNIALMPDAVVRIPLLNSAEMKLAHAVVIPLLMPGALPFRNTFETGDMLAVIVDAPGYLRPGDDIEASVFYNTKKSSTLAVQNGSVNSWQVNSEGCVKIHLTDNDKSIKAAIIDCDGEKSGVSLSLIPPGRKCPTRLLFPGKGDYFPSGGSYTLFPNLITLGEYFSGSILDYPWGCGEQTASKLNALSFMYQLGIDRLIPRIEDEIFLGLDRMKLFEKEPGLLSIFESGEPTIEATSVILNHLRPYENLRFQPGIDLCGRIRATLKKNGIQTSLNQSMIENNSHRNILDLYSVEQIMDSYFSSNCDKNLRAKILDDFCKLARYDDGKLTWTKSTSWGRNYYLTFNFLRMLLKENRDSLSIPCSTTKTFRVRRNSFYSFLEDLKLIAPVKVRRNEEVVVENSFWNLLNSATGRAGSKLYLTTAEMVALLSLIVDMNRNSPISTSVMLDNVEFDVEERLPTSDSVEIISERGIILVHSIPDESSTDENGAAANPLQLLINKKECGLGGRIPMSIKIPGDVPVPLLTLELPGNISITGDNVRYRDSQTIDIFTGARNKEIKLHALAIRRGTGRIRASISDMYDLENFQASPWQSVKVV